MYISNVLKLDFAYELYIPLSLQIERYESDKYYLRYVDSHSLLELGISSENGMLVSIELITVYSYSIGQMLTMPKNIEKGLPLFDLSLWKQDRSIDIHNPVELVFVSNDTAMLIIDRNLKANKVLYSENLKFAISDGSPCWLSFDNLTNDRIAHIKSNVRPNLKSTDFNINI